MMECLKNIIGVTPDLCDCLKDGLTADQLQAMGASNSGLFLDGLPGGLDLKALAEASVCKNLAVMTLTAIANATKAVESDLVVALNAQYQKNLKTFNGMIGQLSYNGSIQTVKRYQALLLKASDGADAVIQINRIGLILNGSELIDLKIYQAPRDSAVGVLVKTFQIQSSANNYVYFTPPGGNVILPLSVGAKPVDYYFVYDSQTGAGVAPKNNKVDCDCPGSNNNIVKQYIKPMGVQFDEENNFSTAVADKYTHGILLDAVLRCNNEQLVCGQYTNEEAVAVVLAYAVQFKAGELAIEEVMKTREINRYTMQDKEYLWGKRNHFIKEYQSRITYLSTSIDVTGSSCFVCRNNDIYMSQTIITDGDAQNVYDAGRAIIDTNARNFHASYDGHNLPGVIYPD